MDLLRGLVDAEPLALRVREALTRACDVDASQQNLVALHEVVQPGEDALEVLVEHWVSHEPVTPSRCQPGVERGRAGPVVVESEKTFATPTGMPP